MIETKMKEAIREKCKDCCYDPYDGGMKNVYECVDQNCALWAYRPNARLFKDIVYYLVPMKDDREQKTYEPAIWKTRDLTKEERAKLDKQIERGKKLAQKSKS